jgi:hypothetical protein
MQEMQKFFADALIAERQKRERTDTKCECISPEASSLQIYLKSENATTIWGSNFRFFFNIAWAGVPLYSAMWHPQNLAEWLVNQPGIAYLGVIVGLLFQLCDKKFASWLAEKFKIKPNRLGKVSIDNARQL